MCKYMLNDCICIKFFLFKMLIIFIYYGLGNCVRDILYVKINVCIL